MNLRAIFIVAFITIVTIGAIAQHRPRHHRPKRYDFKNVDVSKVDSESLKSGIEADLKRADSLRALYNYVNADEKNYKGAILSVDYITTDLKTFNAELAANNLNQLSDDGLISVSYGMTSLMKRFLLEYYFSVFFNKTAKTDNVRVKVGGVSLVNFHVGFDVLNQKRWSLIPMIGINQQFTKIKVERTDDGLLPAPNSLGSITQEYHDTRIRKSTWNASGAIELDYRASYEPRVGGVIIGLRYGMVKSINEGDYKVDRDEVNYDPKISLRDSYFSVVFKFVTASPRDRKRRPL
jgi:hypothetical protein